MIQALQQLLSHHPTLALITMATALCLSGCDQAQPVSYQIPKEPRSITTPTMPAAPAPAASTSGNMQILPGMEQAAAAAGEVSYSVPVGWIELPPSGIRKGTLRVTSEVGSAEITILTFPGNVGGSLANINRWRGQIGLAAATATDLPAYTEDYQIAGHRGLYVRLEGSKQSILGALLPFHGNTWFFKMLGDSPTVLANEDAMREFLDSIQFDDHSH